MNKLSKLLNVVIYLCIISYALPTGVMMGIAIQKNIGMPVDYSGRNMPGFTKKKALRL